MSHLTPNMHTSKRICSTRGSQTEANWATKCHPRMEFRSWASDKHRQCEGSGQSGRFTAEWWPSVLKTSNTPRVNSGNRQTPAAKHLLLVEFGAQAMLSAISKVLSTQHLNENTIFIFFVKTARPQIASPHTKTAQQQKEPDPGRSDSYSKMTE